MALLLRRTLVLLFIGIGIVQAQTEKLNFVVKPYIQNVSTDGITVLWETNIPSNGIVKYGKANLAENNARLDSSVITENTNLMHAVRLNNLQAENKYFYKVIVFVNSDTIQYKINPFMTAPVSEIPITFAVFGDTQQQSDTTIWNRIAKLALSERPNFGLIVGDLVDIGGELPQWKYQFLSNGNSFMESIPLFPVIGNHDIIYDDEAENFNKYVKYPGTENYYTVKYGIAQLFVLDSNEDMAPGSKQYSWLENELAKSKAQWKIAAHHHPPYTSDNDDYGNTETSIALNGDPNFDPIIPLYEKFNVDIVFYGHIHSYERTWPLANNKVDENGVVYVQCGGAGGDNEYSGIIRSWFSAKLKSNHHFCLVSINGSKLYLNAISEHGDLFDQYIIDKSDKLLKRENYKGESLSAPIIESLNDKFISELEVSIKSYNENSDIRYTLDGSIPTKNSTLYEEPFEISTSSIVKAIVFSNDSESKCTEKKITKTDANLSVDLKSVNKGLRYNYYLGENWTYLPEFDELKVVKDGVSNNLLINEIKDREDQFAISYYGYINIEEEDVYDFYLLSDDGARLYLDDELVVDNNGSHSPRTRSGNIGLQKGYHKFYLEYYDDCEGEELKLFYKSSKFSKTKVPDQMFVH